MVEKTGEKDKNRAFKSFAFGELSEGLNRGIK
jgi:hypothetical protein